MSNDIKKEKLCTEDLEQSSGGWMFGGNTYTNDQYNAVGITHSHKRIGADAYMIKVGDSLHAITSDEANALVSICLKTGATIKLPSTNASTQTDNLNPFNRNLPTNTK